MLIGNHLADRVIHLPLRTLANGETEMKNRDGVNIFPGMRNGVE